MGNGSDGIEACYRRYAPTVFRRARHLLGSEADAHEVVQDVFLSLFEQPAQYGARSSLVTFLYSATTHACLNRIKQTSNRARLLSERFRPGSELAPKQELTPEERTHLFWILQRMPDQLARVLIHAYVDELTHDEIAELIGCSRRNVGKLLERVTAWVSAEEERVCGT